MKPLIVMPAVKNVHVTREAIDSVINHPVDIILCANGADQDVIDLMYQYKELKPDRVSVWIEPVNIGVNPVWNKFVAYFMNTDYTHIGILSSDVILHHQWLEYLERWDSISDVPIPVEVDRDTLKLGIDVSENKREIATEGLNGIFIWLTKFQAKVSFPIPEDIKIWFGDNWIHESLRQQGYATVIHHNFRAFHGGSVTLQAMEGTNALIEQDKVAWETKVKKLLYE